MGVELSFGTLKRLERIFSAEDRAVVADLLVNECGENLPGCEGATSTSLERIRFAVLKVSEGSTSKLLDALQLAQVDWRDLLVAAGFAEDVTIHSAWWPR